MQPPKDHTAANFQNTQERAQRRHSAEDVSRMLAVCPSFDQGDGYNPSLMQVKLCSRSIDIMLLKVYRGAALYMSLVNTTARSFHTGPHLKGFLVGKPALAMRTASKTPPALSCSKT